MRHFSFISVLVLYSFLYWSIFFRHLNFIFYSIVWRWMRVNKSTAITTSASIKWVDIKMNHSVKKLINENIKNTGGYWNMTQSDSILYATGLQFFLHLFHFFYFLLFLSQKKKIYINCSRMVTSVVRQLLSILVRVSLSLILFVFPYARVSASTTEVQLWWFNNDTEETV